MAAPGRRPPPSFYMLDYRSLQRNNNGALEIDTRLFSDPPVGDVPPPRTADVPPPNVIPRLLFGAEEGGNPTRADDPNLVFIFSGNSSPRMTQPNVYKKPCLSEYTIKVTQDHIDARLMCCICFEEYPLDGNAVQLSCGHIYHLECIDRWMSTKNTCPYCRKSLLKKVSSSRVVSEDAVNIWNGLSFLGFVAPDTSFTVPQSGSVLITRPEPTSPDQFYSVFEVPPAAEAPQLAQERPHLVSGTVRLTATPQTNEQARMNRQHDSSAS